MLVVVTHIEGNSHRSYSLVNRPCKYMEVAQHGCKALWEVGLNFTIAIARKLSGKVMSSGGWWSAEEQQCSEPLIITLTGQATQLYNDTYEKLPLVWARALGPAVM